MVEGISPIWLSRILDLALEEDLGARGDVTTQAAFGPEVRGRIRYEARQEGILAGAALIPEIAAKIDPKIEVEDLADDGIELTPMQVFARARGPYRSLMTLERLSLNWIGRLSGVATQTRAFVKKAGGRVQVADTRKTTPGHRALEKYAVRKGGGVNHRFGLDDAAMIKDNHRAAFPGSLAELVSQVRRSLSHSQRLIVEIEDEANVGIAIEAGADVILLDNMSPELISRIVAAHRGKVIFEASGGINLDTIEAYAKTGVDLVSLGSLTTQARWLDVSVETIVES